MAERRTIAAPGAPAAVGGYAQALRVDGATSLVFVSGQIPVGRDGAVPASFAEQARLVWAHVAAQIEAAGLTMDDLVKVTIFLADRRYADENRRAREAALGGRAVALTVIIADIFDPAWLLEIEAVAAR